MRDVDSYLIVGLLFGRRADATLAAVSPRIHRWRCGDVQLAVGMAVDLLSSMHCGILLRGERFSTGSGVRDAGKTRE
jgi:hypothetical protein